MNHFAKRRQKLVQLMTAQHLDAIAVVPGANFVYLSGLHFHLMERPTLLFVAANGNVLGIVPELERTKWSETFPDATTFYWQDSDGYETAFSDAAVALGSARIGVEEQRMRFFEADALRQHYGQDAIARGGAVLDALRVSKDSAEIKSTERAIEISETALAETLDEVRTGMSERAICNILKMRMLANGADGFAFDPIVLAGEKAANPHGSPDETPLLAGDPLLIDFGASFEGYNADITRTFFCKHASDEHAAIYETVLAANTKGREIAGPSLSAHDLDLAVTDVLAKSAYRDMILHKTGHGLGLDVHEAPQVMIGNHARLVPGTLLTIEPGLYRANDIGVRIEDDVLIGEKSSRSLTSFDRGLRLIGG